MERIPDVTDRTSHVPRMAHRRFADAKHLTVEAVDLPDAVLGFVERHLFDLDLGGTYGDPSEGDPIQYDELCVEHNKGDVKIVVYKRAILLFTSNSEAIRQIHQVCCGLDDLAAERRA